MQDLNDQQKESNNPVTTATRTLLMPRPAWMLGRLKKSQLSNRPSRACYGLLWGLIGDTSWTLLNQLIIQVQVSAVLGPKARGFDSGLNQIFLSQQNDRFYTSQQYLS